MRKLLVLIFCCFFLLIFPHKALAIVNPLDYPNNRFGIHILDDNDIEDAAKLVNSSGGDWGYVTLVIREDERDIKRWQKVFDNLRQRHLIPIIRLASKQGPGGWEKFSEEEIDNWIYFLNSLNWVIKNRYLIFANEPNHADEWGGEVKPEEYATLLCLYQQKLKQASENFFLIHAGLDASAPSDQKHLDEVIFVKRESESGFDFFNCFDGWASHSYPNPGFSGSEYAAGRGSIRTYYWELSLLKSLGLKRELPVFITETGWLNNLASGKLKYAFEEVWTDDNLVAVTPFVLSYFDPPFDIFSWKDKNGNFLPFYEEIRNLSKTKGRPKQEDRAEIKMAFIPKIAFSETHFYGAILVANNGQSILNQENCRFVILVSDSEMIEMELFKELLPGKKELLSFKLNTPQGLNNLRGKIFLVKDGANISGDYNFETYLLRTISLKDKFSSFFKSVIEAWSLKWLKSDY